MDSFGGEQRRIWLWRFVEQVENPPRLFTIQPDDRIALEHFPGLPMGGLNDELIERRAFEVGGGLDDFPHTRRNAGDKCSRWLSEAIPPVTLRGKMNRE
jgi:hypothetical protein